MSEKEDRIKRILEGDTEGMYPHEERIVKKAVPFNQRRQNLKQFLFSGTETLISDIQQIYPAVGVIVIVNNDDRDSANVSRVTFKTLSKCGGLTVHKTQSLSHGKLYREVLRGVSGSFDHVLCVVENGFVTVKRNRFNFESGE